MQLLSRRADQGHQPAFPTRAARGMQPVGPLRRPLLVGRRTQRPARRWRYWLDAEASRWLGACVTRIFVIATSQSHSRDAPRKTALALDSYLAAKSQEPAPATGNVKRSVMRQSGVSTLQSYSTAVHSASHFKSQSNMTHDRVPCSERCIYRFTSCRSLHN